MTQNRTPPAYQEYASDLISRIEYRTMTLSQRGLLYSMKLECWVNKFLPESPDLLARMLGFDPHEVGADIPYVMAFFDVENGMIFSPDLEAYRVHLDLIRERQAAGGKVGAAKTNARKTRTKQGIASKSPGKPTSNPTGKPTSNPRVDPRVLSRVEQSPAMGAGREEQPTLTTVVSRGGEDAF
jgi:hypothetical protein